jgi:alkaline phosphatase D
MSSLRIPGLGPIVGHTADDRCRIWIRAGDPEDEGADLSSFRRTIGLIAVIGVNDEPLTGWPIYYFRLHREYDRTGTFLLGKESGIDSNTEIVSLQPDTKYTVRVATLTIDDPFPDDEMISSELLLERLPAAEVWRDILEDRQQLEGDRSIAEFQTFPDALQVSDQLSFIVGSCRFPGFLWRVKHADRIFGPIARMVSDPSKKEPAPRFVLMVGDQIYADKLNRFVPVGRADTFEEFQERYQSAFRSRNMRKLLKTVPNYMILDDHEIEDNWTQDRFVDGSKRDLFVLAMNAYMSYQWCHGPRTFGTRLYYTFECGGYPYFVLDTRTQRYMNTEHPTLDDNHMLGRLSLGDEPNQLSRLLEWLKTQQAVRDNIPKFIVTSSVFVPNPVDAREGSSKARKEKSDSWPGYPTTRRLILDCIVENNIQNVVFLSGDIHCSNVAQIHFSGSPAAQKLKAFSVTSSAFYWPFPFADGDPSNYVHDSTRENQQDTFMLTSGVRMDYKADNFTQEDNFCRIDIDRGKRQLVVRAFDKEGNLIEEPTQSGKNRKIESKIKLAKW